MSDMNKKNSKLPLILLLLVALAGLAYFVLGPKQVKEVSEPTAPVATTEQPVTTPEATQPTGEQAPAVVETKTLDIPAASGPAATPETAALPTDAAVDAMMTDRKLGSDSAPVKVVEYSSLTCGHCSAFHKNDFPKIKEAYIDTSKVQFIFKEFPLNKPAVDASKLLRCMPEDKFVPFQSMLFEEQEKWAYNEAYLNILKQNAKLAGLSEQQVEDCLNNKALEARIIADMKVAGEKYKIESTPSFVINDGAKVIVGHQSISVFFDAFNAAAGSSTPAPEAPAVEEKKE